MILYLSVACVDRQCGNAWGDRGRILILRCPGRPSIGKRATFYEDLCIVYCTHIYLIRNIIKGGILKEFQPGTTIHNLTNMRVFTFWRLTFWTNFRLFECQNFPSLTGTGLEGVRGKIIWQVKNEFSLWRSLFPQYSLLHNRHSPRVYY